MSEDQLNGDIKSVLNSYFNTITKSNLNKDDYKKAHERMYMILKTIFTKADLTPNYYRYFLDTFYNLSKITQGFSLARMFYGLEHFSKELSVVEGYTNMMSLISATYIPEERYTGIKFVNMEKVMNSFITTDSRQYLASFYKIE